MMVHGRRGGRGGGRIGKMAQPDPLIEAMKIVQVEEAYRTIFLKDLKLLPGK